MNESAREQRVIRLLQFLGGSLLAVLLPALAVFVAAHGILRFPYIQYALLGSFFIYIADESSARQRLAVVLVAAVLCLVAQTSAVQRAPSFRDVAYMLGLACIAVSGVRTSWAAPGQRRHAVETAVGVTLFPVLVAEALLVRRALNDAYSPTYDLYAFVFDARLGGQASFALARLFARSSRANAFLWEIYRALPVILGLLYGYTRNRGKQRQGARAAVLLFAASLLAVVGYHLVPISGPLFAFAEFPVEPSTDIGKHLSLLPLNPDILRNGVPSLHFAAAILAWWNLRDLGVVLRFIAGFFLVGTFLATLGTGQHYLVDLIMTVPFSLALQAALMSAEPSSPRRRWCAVAFGSLLTVVWLGALRSATFVTNAPEVVVLGLTFISVTVPFVLENRLGERT